MAMGVAMRVEIDGKMLLWGCTTHDLLCGCGEFQVIFWWWGFRALDRMCLLGDV